MTISLPLEEIKKGYVEGGESLTELARRHGVSSGTIRGRLLEMGVTLRRRGCPHNRKPIPLPLEEIRNALEGGSNYALEARKYGGVGEDDTEQVQG